MKCDPIKFSVMSHSVEYGDGKSFWEWMIQMWLNGRIVSTESGPRRLCNSRPAAVAQARQRIVELKSHRLFAIDITKKHIADGEARCGSSCAIAQALWNNQDRMGLPCGEYDFRVVPYAAWADADGITLRKRYGSEPEKSIPPHLWPDIVTPHRRGTCSESLDEWAMNWDDWAESRSLHLAEWREQHGYRDGARPCRPAPASFVLDLDSFSATPV